MQVFLNNEALQTEAATVSELSDQLSLPAMGVALAVDGKLVQKASWADTPLHEGARLTVIKAVCGG